MLGLSSSSGLDAGTGVRTSHSFGKPVGDLNLMQIISSVQNDIKNLRAHLDNIPAFPKGKT